MGAAPRVLLLDDDEDLLGLMRELFALRGAPVLAVTALEALAAHPDEALACSVAILDINLGAGRPSGLDALAWLRARGFSGRVVLLTGHARGHPLVRLAGETEGVTLLEKPVDVDLLESFALRAA
jgi:DNA-binding NtrC family response regulator